MLKTMDLNMSMDNKTFKETMKALKTELSALQLKIKDYKIPVIIVFEGWSLSGKGTQISRILDPLDPRYFNVYTMQRLQEDAVLRPYIWSFFTKTPEKGRIALIDRSWLRGLLPGGGGFNLSPREKKSLLQDINAFEEQLINDGHVIIKIFLHTSKAEQKKRLMETSNNPSLKWRVTKGDWEQNGNFEKHQKIYEDLLFSNEPKGSKWELVAATDKNYATVKVYKIIINKIYDEISRRENLMNQPPEAPKSWPQRVFALNSIDLSRDIDDFEYKRKIEKYHNEMHKICFDMYQKRKAAVIVFEGWDAAGKGGAIKRLTQALDPRGYEVIPVPAPTQEELNHHYLWRFWRKMPKDGHIAIFDRSWYGRVLVERVEGLCTEAEWQRAYKEINDMELAIANHGAVVMKFWLHIDKEEQLARFTRRQENPLKQYKITDEDWRNRDKWDLYENAVNDMINLTDKVHAPWHIVESNSKKYARVKVLEQVVNTLSRYLYE